MQGTVALSPEDLERFRQDLKVQYGLDKPLLLRYGIWLKNVVQFDFGNSLTTRTPVLDQIIEKLPVSLSFGLTSFFLTYLICIPLGILLAFRDQSVFDKSISFVLIFLHTLPVLIIGILLLLTFCTDRISDHLSLFPLGGFHGDAYSELSWFGKLKDLSYHLFLPVLTFVLGNFTFLTFFQKNLMLDVMKSEYITTARSKGLPQQRIIWKHALRNALIPISVGFGSILGVFLAGSIIIERMFSLPGLGLLTIESLQARDYNVLMALTYFQTLALLFGNILNDFILTFLDPRIKFE